MKITMEAIRHFGHEDPITIAIATLEAQGKEELAAALLERVLPDKEEDPDEWDFVMVIN